MLALLSCALGVEAPIKAATPVDEASSYYAQHNYAKSLQVLDKITAGTRSAGSHYYRALNLQALHRYDEAYSEFSAVAKQKKDMRLAALAQQGLGGLSHRPKQSSSSAATTDAAASKIASNSLKPDSSGNFTDSKWQVQHAPDPSKMVREVTESPFKIIQTSPGCGHHRR